MTERGEGFSSNWPSSRQNGFAHPLKTSETSLRHVHRRAALCLRDAIGASAANLGRLVSGLVLQMASHGGAQTTSGNGRDAFEGSGSDFFDESQFDEKVAEFGLEPTMAYVRVARVRKKVSQAAINKRRYRAERKAKGFEEYVVEVPRDEDAKSTVYAVAQAIVEDKEDKKTCDRSILSVVSSPELLKLSSALSTSTINVSSIVELTKRGDLAKIAEIHTAHPALLGDLSRLATSSSDFLSGARMPGPS